MGLALEGLGNLFDIGTCWAPLDLDTADGATGKRISMLPGRTVTILFSAGASASGDVTLDIQQHTAYTGGTTKDLDSDPSTGVVGSYGIDHYYTKSETLLDNDEPWVRVTQAEASEVTLLAATYATTQKLVAIEVTAGQLAEGYTHISVACTATSTAQLSSCIYIVSGLRYPRRADRLQNLLRPGAANA
ncbi:MAG: hypothetical protein ABWY81_10985 [Jiangellaceae bacterium]